jgi:Gram-negative bacterial TonB protein C-terminal
MRTLAFSLLAWSLMAALASGQSVDVAKTEGGDLPIYRPALIGSGPNSLINQIDEQGLIKQGQKSASIMFSCIVAKNGDIAWSEAYRGTPDSKLLEQEVLKRMRDVKFIPAIHNHRPVTVVFYGTVVFGVVDGKPRLRIFANQQLEELKKEADFIDPQPYFGEDSKFDGFRYPDTGSPVQVTGSADVALNIDTDGNLKNIRIVSEYPPLLGFGDAAIFGFKKAKFIPAFRNGQPVESNVTLAVYFQPQS